MKEQLMAEAREKRSLNFQGHTHQIFADLSPLTITKCRALKPLLQVLQQQQISYQWGFPFSVKFTYKGSKHTCHSAGNLQRTL